MSQKKESFVCVHCKETIQCFEKRPSHCPNCDKPFIIKPKGLKKEGNEPFIIREYFINDKGHIEDVERIIYPSDHKE